MPVAQTATLPKSFPAGMIAETHNRPVENVSTVRFGFHAWTDIRNRKTHGVRFGMPGHYATLPRMEMILLPTLTVPKLRPKNGGFAVGKVTPFGISAAAGVGSDVEQRQQLPSETCQKLTHAYGDKGFVILESLTAEAPEAMWESAAIFIGVMKCGEIKGVEVIQEDLPDWLKNEAPRMLDAAIEDGVTLKREDFPGWFVTSDFPEGYVVKLKAAARDKGLRMIAEAAKGIKATNAKALTVLNKTKKELGQAKAGVNDSKAIADDLDNFLSYHHPSFSFDTEVERSARATAGVVEAVRESGVQTSAQMEKLLEQNNRLLEQNNVLAKELIGSKKKDEKAA